jgi:hypothetical protein
MSGLIRLAQVNKRLIHTTRHLPDLAHVASARAVVLCFHNLIVTMVEVRTKAKTRYVKMDAYKMLPAHAVWEVAA